MADRAYQVSQTRFFKIPASLRLSLAISSLRELTLNQVWSMPCPYHQKAQKQMSSVARS
jgi:hypothetical protein